jgi:hypothetical protein
VNHSADFDRIATHLHHPIPTLRSLEIIARSQRPRILELPSNLRDGLFLYLKKLCLNGISSFRGLQTFPHITELLLYTNAYLKITNITLLVALGQLPGLEKVYITFHDVWDTGIDPIGMITLPCVQEIRLSAFHVRVPMIPVAVPPILRFLKLPKATSLTVQQSPSLLPRDLSILPVTSFGEHLPNYVELLDLRIHTAAESGTVVFQSPSQAIFTYRTAALRDFKQEARLWGNLPLRSVRRVTAVLGDLVLIGGEDAWLVDLFGKLDFLELLELVGDCGHVLRRLRRRMVWGATWVDIRTPIVRGGEYAKCQAFRFESVKGSLGLDQMTVTYIPDSTVHEGLALDPDAECSNDDEDWDEDYCEGSDEDDEDEDDEDEDDED